MNREPRCEDVAELAAELALDVAAGPERDAALRHVAGCPGCRRLLSDLTAVGEDLLVLAPPREPPPGFETRVLARLAEPFPADGRVRSDGRTRAGGPVPGRSRWRGPLAAAVAAVLAGVLAAGSVLVATSEDRRLGAAYRALLGEAGGSAFSVAPLVGPEGRVGTVFGYRGSPSWILVSLAPDADLEGTFRVEAATTDGATIELGRAVLGPEAPAWGRALPIDLSGVRGVRLLGVAGDLSASLDGDEGGWAQASTAGSTSSGAVIPLRHRPVRRSNS